ncbi:protoporphyrinogen oxidase, partial [bacterium]|nr:protoporphyrinogen oxidase [bacterium]
KDLVSKLLKGKIKKIERNAAIYSHGKFTPYPFQANTYGLPVDVVKESLIGFIDTLIKPEQDLQNDNYEKWIYRTFGSGIANHFMIPYNRKLWCCKLSELTTDWVAMYIPKASLEIVLDGALGIKTHTLGYNAFFYYPEKGGIQGLIDGFTSTVKNIHTGVELVSIDTKNRIIHTSNGMEFDYELLVSSIPLVRLLELIIDLPESLKRFLSNLNYVSVLNFNLGVSREKISPYHWIYFPEDNFSFYRCGFPSNFSDNLAPKKTSSIYVEMSTRKGNIVDEKDAYGRVVEGLLECGILKSSSEIIHKSIRFMNFAYILYNHQRNEVLNLLLDYLSKNKILSIGRFGAWEYSAMEEAIIWGKKTGDIISYDLS